MALKGLAFNSRRLHHFLMESHYFVSLKKTDEGYSVWVPGLPGCWSQGATEDEALSNIRDAIRDYLAVARELASEDEVRGSRSESLTMRSRSITRSGFAF